MQIDEIIEKIKKNNFNVFSVALMDENGISAGRVNRSNLCNNSYSIAKSFTVAAIGILWDSGKINIEDKAYDILQKYFPKEFDERWKDVTVEHLMTHRGGISRAYDIDVEDIHGFSNEDFLKAILSDPLFCEPGTEYRYTDAAFYILSRIVTEVSGQGLDDFLRPTLFGKLGYQELAWSKCPAGYCMGGTGLYIRTDDMVKLGFVYANGGVYCGQRIFSEKWVRLVLERGYEFSQYGNTGIYTKGGMFGQVLCFSPKKKTAWAWHCYETEHDSNEILNKILCQ